MRLALGVLPLRMTSIAVIGAGWRAQFFIRLAKMMPEKFEIVGVVARTEDVRTELSLEFGVQTFSSVSQLLSYKKPDFAVTSVSWDANPGIVEELVNAGVHVLSETPPAPTLEALQQLWKQVGSSGLVQVAEQYLFLPGHAARLAITESGAIGEIGSVEISSTHGYHAVSIMRGFLKPGFEPTTITTRQFEAPLVDPLARAGWNSDLNPKNAKTTVSLIDFGTGKSGLYNFVDNQWHNQLRHRRIVVRGSRGELVDDSVIRLVDGPAITTSRIERYQLGYDLNLDGFDTEHLSFDGKVVFKNPFTGLRLMDEEIAIAQLMSQMGDWVEGKAQAPYPLAEACQDHLISLAIDESISTGQTVTTERQAWAN
jgi:predicted dehydrogenase